MPYIRRRERLSRRRRDLRIGGIRDGYEADVVVLAAKAAPGQRLIRVLEPMGAGKRRAVENAVDIVAKHHGTQRLAWSRHTAGSEHAPVQSAEMELAHEARLIEALREAPVRRVQTRLVDVERNNVSIAWVPNTALGPDPEPSVPRLTETGSSTRSASVNAAPGGTGHTTIAGVPALIKQYAMTDSTLELDHAVDIAFSVTATAPNPGSVSVSASGSFSYTGSVSPIVAALTVDQDQQVLPPAATTRFSATVSNASGFTIDWIKISVDGGTPTIATIPAGSSSGSIDWPQTGGNPSEHTSTATV